VLGGMLTEPTLPVVHRRCQLARVPVHVPVPGQRHLLQPRPGRDRGHAGDLLPDPPVHHLRHRLGVLQLPRCDRAAQRAWPVEPGGLGFAQRTPQPGGGRVVHHPARLLLGQRLADGCFVPALRCVPCHVLPLHAEHVQAVRVGPFRLATVSGRDLLAVSGQALAEDVLGRESLPNVKISARVESSPFQGEPVVPGQLGGGLAARRRVGDPPRCGPGPWSKPR
jgi:hypothetical protein